MQRVIEIPNRPNISEDVADRVREMVVDDLLSPGERINEVHLARRLQVSRTPLREALARLVAEGCIISIPRRGFFVGELTVEEFRNLYPIRAILDPKALELSGLPPSKQIAKLEAMNRKILEAGNADHIIRLDDAWHLELLAGCPNRILLDLIRQFMRRTRRYELALMREHENVRTTLQNHNRILRALRAGDLPAACSALRKNMEAGTGPILNWLARRKTIKSGEKGE